MRCSSVVLLLSSLSLVACDDGAKKLKIVDAGDPGVDGAVTSVDAPVDGPVDGPVDAPGVVCTTSTENFGDKGALTGQAIFDAGMDAAGATDDLLVFVALLEPTMPADAIQVDLFAGYGVFPGAVTPGTYQLTGEELDFATCGACVRIFTNVDAQGQDDGIYMPTGGTLTVTATGTAVGQTLTGSVSNLTFQHVNIDPTTGTTTPVGDSCVTAMTNATFTGSLIAPPQQ